MCRDGRAHTTITPLSAGIAGRLWDFELNKWALRHRHKQWLDQEILPLLNNGGSVSVEGQASRTGLSGHNRRLSWARAQAVLRYLRENTHRAFGVRYQESRGEERAAEAGQADNTEDDWYRAVRVSAWSRPIPPPIRRNANPPRSVPRFTYRAFSRHEHKRDVPGRGPPGAFDAVLDEGFSRLRGWLFSRSIVLTVGSEISSKRRTPHVRVDHAVNEVYILVVHDRRLYGADEVDVWETSYLYFYGPPSGSVVVRRTTINRLFNEETRVYPPGNPPPPPRPEMEILSRREAAEAMLIIPPPLADAPLVR